MRLSIGCGPSSLPLWLLDCGCWIVVAGFVGSCLCYLVFVLAARAMSSISCVLLLLAAVSAGLAIVFVAAGTLGCILVSTPFLIHVYSLPYSCLTARCSFSVFSCGSDLLPLCTGARHGEVSLRRRGTAGGTFLRILEPSGWPRIQA